MDKIAVNQPTVWKPMHFLLFLVMELLFSVFFRLCFSFVLVAYYVRACDIYDAYLCFFLAMKKIVVGLLSFVFCSLVLVSQ